VDAQWTEAKMLEAQGRPWFAAELQLRLFEGFRQTPFAALLRMVFEKYQTWASAGHQWKVSVAHRLKVFVVHPQKAYWL